MAIRHSNLHPRYIPHTLHKKHLSIYNPKISHFTTNTRFRLQFSITFPRNNHFSLRKFASVNGFSVPNVPEDGARNGGEKNVDFLEIMQRWVIFLQSVCPGGSWWNFYDPNEVEIRATKPITVLDALRRMWGLVENDRWVIFVAFGALIVAALSEISMPSLLAASIFSAQNSDIVVFSRNLRLLVLLCFTSGICSGLRSGCFAIANMILVKRLKETLYAALLFQDIYFFDTEAVGDLTSRLGADCQRLSHVIGNDMNLISRNVLQFFRGQVFAVLLGGMSILTGHVSPEQLTKYVLYCEWLIYATWRVGDNMSSFLQSVGASEKVFRLMDLLPSDQFLSKGVKLQRLIGHIKFVDLSFYYPSREMVPILEHVNISVQANEVVAIVGLSGSGKSTLVNLLLRLYEPTKGQILIDGFPLAELDIRWLRERIGFVGQEPHLFHIDVKSNIRYGCCRDIKQEDVEWAAKQAYAHDFIMSLPNGYDTLVDDDLLSGGQKQRIAIARAILRDPLILILDEPTSALDAQSEQYIKGVLGAFKNDTRAKRTVIFIAHRLSTVEAADRIVVMDGGEVVEMGEHGELLRKDGLYARLIKVQTDALP